MSVQSTALVVILGLGVAGLAGLRLEEKIAKGQIASIQLGDARAKAEAVSEAAAIQKQQDDIALRDAVSEASAQQRIVTRTTTTVKEVPVYVTPAQDASSCVTYGLVRLHDAAALGVDPGTLPLPAGKLDSDCTALKASDLAAGIVSNYGVARQNAEQLNALIADEKARAATLPDTGARSATGHPQASPSRLASSPGSHRVFRWPWAKKP